MVTRKAIVTGGAGGIGRAVCARLAADGLTVVVTDRDEAGARDTAASLPGTDHLAFVLDTTIEQQVDTVFAAAEEAGPVGVLVTIAGGSHGNTPAAAMELAEWNALFALNVTGTFLCARAFLRARTTLPLPHGRIITYTSFAGQTGTSPTGVAYAASKAAVVGLTKHLAVEVAASGITVNAIAPGAVATPAFVNFMPAEAVRAIEAMIPMQRLASTDEIAAVTSFLASEQSSYMTGATIDVNGGALAR